MRGQSSPHLLQRVVFEGARSIERLTTIWANNLFGFTFFYMVVAFSRNTCSCGTPTSWKKLEMDGSAMVERLYFHRQFILRHISSLPAGPMSHTPNAGQALPARWAVRAAGLVRRDSVPLVMPEMGIDNRRLAMHRPFSSVTAIINLGIDSPAMTLVTE
jgi:hypothetical protein